MFHQEELARCFGGDSAGHDLFYGCKPVVAAKEVLCLRSDLFFQADEERTLACVGMPRKEHPLAVKHLEERELGKVGKAPILNRRVGKEDGVGAGLE